MENPRTSDRHTLIRKSQAGVVFALSTLALVAGTWQLNPLCLELSPLLLLVITFYSVTKRFTPFSHFFLGLALGSAPLAAWAAVLGTLASATPFVLAGSVFCWVSGFDLIYALLDVEFDRKKNLQSFPARFGVDATLKLACILHLLAAAGFFAFGRMAHLGPLYWTAWLVVLIELVFEHQLARRGKPEAINKAFFNANTIIGLSLLAGVLFHYLFA